MSGSHVAELLQRFSSIPSACRFTFAATESELRKMRSRMCEWYDFKVRGISSQCKT